MQVNLSAGDESLLQKLVASGRFESVEEAIHEGILAILDEEEFDDEWKSYANDRIEAGLADVAAGRTVPAEEVLAKIKALRTKQA